jgi:hypothetical protein
VLPVRSIIAKVIAVLIACGYAFAMIVDAQGVTPDGAKGLLALLLPLSRIWFPDAIGSFTGHVGRGGRIDTEAPPFLVSAAGWILLVALPASVYFLR